MNNVMMRIRRMVMDVIIIVRFLRVVTVLLLEQRSVMMATPILQMVARIRTVNEHFVEMVFYKKSELMG